MMLRIIRGDALTELRKLPSESVHCGVTSPPYWGLRDYGTGEWEGGDPECDHKGRSQTSGASTLGEWKNGGGQRYKENTGGMPFAGSCGKCGAIRIDAQLGLEKTPEEYVTKLVEILQEFRRVLRSDGTLWLNLGDCYATGAGKVGEHPGGGEQGARWRGDVDRIRDEKRGYLGIHSKDPKRAAALGPMTQPNRMPIAGLKPKDLVGIPWRVAFALQADGWWLRSDVIWNKPNPMPESVTDRPTKSHEYLFLLSKAEHYYYDAEAIKEPQAEYERSRRLREREQGLDTVYNLTRDGNTTPYNQSLTGSARNARSRQDLAALGTRNKRSVWTVATIPYADAHFATYPPELIKPCILAGTSAKGCCSKCGAPQERVTEVEDPEGRLGKSYHDHQNDLSFGNRGMPPADGRPARRTIGWQPTCQCGCETTVPCTVLDMFGGSGTTAEVANGLGRAAILIELNPGYIPLIENRCSMPLFEQTDTEGNHETGR